MKAKNECPEFPYFGAQYPDATCIDGFLWDLDSCENELLTQGGDIPCPFCNKNHFIKYLIDGGLSKAQANESALFLNNKYNHVNQQSK